MVSIFEQRNEDIWQEPSGHMFQLISRPSHKVSRSASSARMEFGNQTEPPCALAFAESRCHKVHWFPRDAQARLGVWVSQLESHHSQSASRYCLFMFIDVYLCSLDVENPLVGVNSTLRDFPGAVMLQDTGGQAP